MDIDFDIRIRDFIAARHLLQKDDTILVGLSGGADSVALLLVLHNLGYDCVAVHCNFHLRGEESNRDERYCRDLCGSMGIRIEVKDFDVESYRKCTNESVEMACRTLRYSWWNSLIQKGAGTVIAVGHHKEDNVETFFLNMLRGCGLNGLKGMLPKSGNVIRPLLDVSRIDIENYLSENAITYVNDSTNFENEYSRNKLRNVILPELERMFPGAVNSISKTIRCLQGNYELYTDSVEELRRKYTSPDNGINLSKIVTDEPHPSMVLFELLYPMGFNMAQVSNILSSMDDSGTCLASGRQFISPVMTLLLDRDFLRPGRGVPEDVPTEAMNVSLSENPFSSTLISKVEFDKLRCAGELTSQSIYLDAKILDIPHEFSLRRWRSGDRLAPFGMKGSKLLSDIFNDLKIPVDKKNSIPVLLCDDMILWVVGIRVSRHFAVSESTRKIMVVTYNPQQ
ncbi:MAG: tRNA lysidine(34) synthetase TilS [Duncaniella sp.]|nr:tRNA lysidine(34) synthetase TilS [Duncaniella sp.]